MVGFIKGKSAIHLARVYGERKRNFVGQHFWARGYFVSTVGRDEAVIREYIRTRRRKISGWSNSTSGVECHLQVVPIHWGRVSDPFCRFERLQSKAPGFAGGYLLIDVVTS